jgi:hypothetical protein
MDLMIRLQHTALFDWFRESGSLVGYPAVLFLHTLGLGTGSAPSSTCGCWARPRGFRSPR